MQVKFSGENHGFLWQNVKFKRLIFEDKTNTFLHGSQEKRYTDMVNGWKNDKKYGRICYPARLRLNLLILKDESRY